MFFRRPKIAPRSQELVFLDADDDLGTIRSKLESSSAEEIYLVIPRRSSVLRTPLEFRILARIANEMSSETVLVTDDPSRRRLANQEGFRTRRGLRTLKHLMLGPDQRPPRLVLPDWVPLPNVMSFLSFVGVLIVAAGAILVVYPQMHVTLVPQTRAVSQSVDITIDPDVKAADPATAILPGSLITLQVDVSSSLPIPSDRTIGQNKAHGEILITSQRSAPFTLPKGTTVRVDGGSKFVTDGDLALPPRVPVRGGITAVEAGTVGNVGPGQISQFDGNGFDQLDVINQRPTTGGTDRQAKVVTDDDKKARDYVMAPKSPYRNYYHSLLTKIMKGGRGEAFKTSRDMPDSAVTLDYVVDKLVIWGSPQKVADELLAFREEVGDFGTLLYAGKDWLDRSLGRRSMTLLAEKVLPAVNAAIGGAKKAAE